MGVRRGALSTPPCASIAAIASSAYGPGAPGQALSLPFATGTFDIVASNYVFDLMAFEDIARALTEFRRILKPTGRTVLVNLTKSDPARMTWCERCYKALPSSAKAYLLGGCRPVCLQHQLAAAGFVAPRRMLVHQALSSEILIAQKPANDHDSTAQPARLDRSTQDN